MRLKKLPTKPSLSLSNGALLPIPNSLLPSPPRTGREGRRDGRGRGGGGPEIRLRGPPLPLHGAPAHPSHSHSHHPFHQAASLLPRSLPLPPPLPPQLLLLTARRTSSTTSSSHLVADGTEEVARVCELIDESVRSGGDMEAALDQCLNIALTHSLVVRVLDRFRHAHEPAHRFFHWAESVPGYAHNKAACNKMLHVLGTNRQFGSMVEFLEEMGELGVLSIDSFKIAIRAFGASGEMKRCLWVFQFMKRFGFDSGVKALDCFLDVLGKENLAKEAQKLFDRMSVEEFYTPNLRTYTALLAAWCNVKNLVKAGRVWNEMLDHGLKPDTVAHNVMLRGLITCQKRSDALKLFELMKAKGPAPDAQTYAIVIRALCKGREMDLAIEVFNEMRVVGHDPNAATCNCLLAGFGNAGQTDRVLTLLKQIEELSFALDSSTYNVIIKLLTSRGMPEEAERIYITMVERDFKPTVHTYTMIMKSFFSTKTHESGCRVWDEMIRKGINPDSNSYTVYVAGHVRHGRVREAEGCILEMVSKGMRAPLVDYNKFVADCCRLGEFNKLEEMAQRMRNDGKFEVADWLSRRVKGVRVRSKV